MSSFLIRKLWLTCSHNCKEQKEHSTHTYHCYYSCQKYKHSFEFNWTFIATKEFPEISAGNLLDAPLKTIVCWIETSSRTISSKVFEKGWDYMFACQGITLTILCLIKSLSSKNCLFLVRKGNFPSVWPLRSSKNSNAAYICIYMYVCVSVCIYIYINIMVSPGWWEKGTGKTGETTSTFYLETLHLFCTIFP